MNKQKGFTIIELIVVVAIIAILAAIILLNQVAYIKGAKAAKIKSDFVNIAFGMSGCYASTGTYAGCILNDTYVSSKARSDVSDQGGTIIYTNPATTAYCASSVLPSGGNVCIDSTGVTKSSASSICLTSISACPN